MCFSIDITTCKDQTVYKYIVVWIKIKVRTDHKRRGPGASKRDKKNLPLCIVQRTQCVDLKATSRSRARSVTKMDDTWRRRGGARSAE